jgi:hypothetical protein
MNVTFSSLFRIRRFAFGMAKVMLFFGICGEPGARGETTNKRMILPGTRAQAMAGAYTAISEDASAGWYNPAGLGFLQGPSASLTANNYSRSKKIVSGTATDSILAENSSSIYPGFAGSVATLGPVVFGWSYFTLEKQNTDESQNLDIIAESSVEPFRYYRSNLTTGNLINIGASVGVALGTHLSIGISEFYYRREKLAALKERSLFNTGLFYDSFIRQSTKNEGTQTVTGAMLRVDTFSLGLSIKIPRALTDKTDIETNTVVYTSSPPELGNEIMTTHREDELIVRTWSLGIAWHPAPWITLSTDAIEYPATESPWIGAGGFNTKTVFDGSAGFEIQAASILLGGGVFSNKSLVKTPKASFAEVEPARIDYLGYTASLGLYGKQAETRIIVVRQSGKGKAQVVQGSLTMHNVTDTTESVSLSSRFQF